MFTEQLVLRVQRVSGNLIITQSGIRLKKISACGERLMDIFDAESWNEFLCRCPMSSVFQSSAWEFQMRQNSWTPEYLRWQEAGAAVYWKKVPALGGCLVEVPGGPVWSSAVSLPECLEGILAFAQNKRALSIRFVPHCLADETAATELEPLLLARGFHPQARKGGTYLIDLSRDETTLFNRCSKNHRRDIRRSMREGVVFRTVEATGSMVSLFHQYYLETFNRKKLEPHAPEFFLRGIRDLAETAKVRIFVAEYGETIYNMALVSFFGRPTYCWGASRPTPNMPPMGEGLHWEIIRWLKAQGYRAYDLGGAPGPDPDPEDGSYWTWRFKAGFGGVYRPNQAIFERVFQPWKLRLLQKVLPYYRRWRRRIS